MLTAQRQNQILALLREKKYASVETLCKALYASGATIRRDLADLENKGLLTRVRGGAALYEGSHEDAPFPVRSGKAIEKKQKIAQLAFHLLKDGQTVFMDSSSTVTELARRLTPVHHLSVVTNGIATGNVLNENTSAKVYLCGGRIQNHSTLVGFSALEMVNRFQADLFFFSCCGLSRETGVTEANEDAAAVKLAMFKNARQKILLCDSTKFDREFFCRTFSLSEMTAMVTDQKPDDAFLKIVPPALKILY